MPTTAAPDLAVPFSRVSTFVRQVMHDVRNGLNAIDLEAAFISEIATEAEVTEEMKKLRAMVSNVAKSLQQLSAHFSTPELNVIDLKAVDFLNAFRERMTERLGAEAAKIKWQSDFAEEEVNVDFELLTVALGEILQNAFQFRSDDAPIFFHAQVEADAAVFEIVESKKAGQPVTLEDWGATPFLSTRRGGYGLGLFRAHRIIEAHGGQLTATARAGTLCSRIALPVLKSA